RETRRRAQDGWPPPPGEPYPGRRHWLAHETQRHGFPMGERDITRRGFVRRSLSAAGPAVVAANTLPFLSAPAESGAARVTVVCVGGRPDDPASGCGGTLARYAARGRPVPGG